MSLGEFPGTAQPDDGLPHAWFAGFAPYDAPADQRLAFAVLVEEHGGSFAVPVEHGGYGARAAAPIARQVMEAAMELGLVGKTR